MSSSEKRKRDHIDLVLNEDVERGDAGFEDYQLLPESFPELSIEAVDTSATFLGHRLSFPFIINSMSGGLGDTDNLNELFAEFAQFEKVGLGLGSIRPCLDDRKYLKEYDVRDECPQIPLLANIGAWQLRDKSVRNELLDLIMQLRVDGVFIHVNTAQELLQPEGERDFIGALEATCDFAQFCPIPVFIKEVGNGLSTVHLGKLVSAGVKGVDVAGLGGTNFVAVESHRNRDPLMRRISNDLAKIGVPTAPAIAGLREWLRELEDPDTGHLYLIGSGGVRTPADIAKALALGADLTAAAAPMLKAANRGRKWLTAQISYFRYGLKCIMLLTGSRRVSDLRGKAYSPQ